jgi:predicted RNase H-like HicB family nuclease
MKYLVVIELTESGHCAYSPDLPGCVATGATREQARAAMRESIRRHLEGLAAEGFHAPMPRAWSTYLDAGE